MDATVLQQITRLRRAAFREKKNKREREGEREN